MSEVNLPNYSFELSVVLSTVEKVNSSSICHIFVCLKLHINQVSLD